MPPAWLRHLLPFWVRPRAEPTVSTRTRLLRMLDAALRIEIAVAVIWWIVGRD